MAVESEILKPFSPEYKIGLRADDPNGDIGVLTAGKKAIWKATLLEGLLSTPLSNQVAYGTKGITRENYSRTT